jgi:hypothetical protein
MGVDYLLTTQLFLFQAPVSGRNSMLPILRDRPSIIFHLACMQCVTHMLHKNTCRPRSLNADTHRSLS